MIVDVVKSESEGPQLLREYACDALSKELLDTKMPGNTRIEISDHSLLSPRDKLIASLEAISENVVNNVRYSENVVQDEKILTQDNLIAYIQKMRVDKEYGDLTMLLTLQLMLSCYAVIVKCEAVHGLLSEEAMATCTMGIGDPQFKIRLYFYAMPSSRCNECHYAHIMDCNPNATGLLHSPHSKKMWYYIHIWSRCFWNSNRFVIKDAPGSGKGLFANDVFDKDFIVTIYPKGVGYGSLDYLPDDCDKRHIYVHRGVFYCNALDAAKYKWDQKTATYVPLPEDAGIGLAMFVNSSKGDVQGDYNCKFETVEVWNPTTDSVEEYYGLVAKEKIEPGQQFIAKYFMDRADKRARDAQTEDEERLCLTKSDSVVRALRTPTKKEKLSRPIPIDSAATKHFESCVATLPEKRKRGTPKVEGGHDLKTLKKQKQRTSTRLVKAKAVSITTTCSPLGEQKTKKTRGPYKKKEPKSKAPDSKAPKQEMTPTHEKIVAEQIDTTTNGVTQTSELVKDEAKIREDMVKEFADEKERIKDECKKTLANAARQHESELKIQILQANAVHAKSINELQTSLNTKIATLTAQLTGYETEIMQLRNQLAPYQQESDNASILSQIKTQDQLGITDQRLDLAYQRIEQRNQRRPHHSFSERGLWTHTEGAFPTTQPTLLHSPILPALLPAEPQLALTQPPQQAVLPVVQVVPVLEVKAEESKSN
jgi:hypothetical protein